MYFSEDSYYIFHITTLLFLIFITARYYKNYRENKNPSAKLLATSFSIITISQLVFCFIRLNPLLYVTAELVQLIGYIILLITFIKVLKDGKKTKPARYHR
jgi:Na+/proline symporter